MFFLILSFKLKIPMPISYLVSINITTFLLYLYDKISSKISKLRIPEIVLHLYTFFGGSPAAFVAQKTISHKSSKESFQSVFKNIVIFHIVLLIAFASFVIYSA